MTNRELRDYELTARAAAAVYAVMVKDAEERCPGAVPAPESKNYAWRYAYAALNTDKPPS